jgi:hypothetical protein
VITPAIAVALVFVVLTDVWDRWFAIAGVITLAFVHFVRVLMASVVATGDALVVRNVFRSWSIPWVEITEVTSRSRGRHGAVAVIRTTTGRRIVGASIRMRAGDVDAAVARLNGAVAAHQVHA